MKCPFFTRRIHSYRWSGIKCTSDKWSNGLTIGDITLWDKDKRENYIKEFCNGDYKNCPQYRNHGGK
jgi:hypothetical protein